jgi:hypothetical protein
VSELTLPLTNTGRKYGYIIWPKSRDEEIRTLLGDGHDLAIMLPSGRRRRGAVDWKHHRISIGYSVTRSLTQGTERVRLRLLPDGRLEIDFI